jgi:YidC/Oxa1 family membrane protein insertase
MTIFVRVVLFWVAASLLPAVSTISAQSGPERVTKVFEHRFGGVEGEPGFLVQFDPVGASVRSITLLDHDAPRTSRSDPREPYQIVMPEFADPADPSRGTFTWLQLSADDSAQLPGIPDGLDLSTWDVAEREGDRVRFTLRTNHGLTFERVYAYDLGRRDLRLEFAVLADAATTAAAGTPIRVGLDGVALAAPKSEWVLGSLPSLAVGTSTSASAGETETFYHPPGDEVPLAERVLLAEKPADGTIGYAGTANRFFGCFLYPSDAAAAESLLRAQVAFRVPKLPQAGAPRYSIPQVRYDLRLVVPAAGAEARAVFRLYLGPKSSRIFDENEEYVRFRPVMKHTLDPMCFCSIPGARSIATFLLWLMTILQSFLGNWGVAIIALTLIVRGILAPLNFRMQKSMRAYGQRMAVLKPKLDALQKKYAADPRLLQQQMVAFQREHKLFPPLGGCLPLFMTIPVFIGLFTALRVAYELRQQPFALWIDDLSRPDQLFALGLSWLPHFNLLPILMVGMWLWLQAGTPLPTDPQQRQMMKIMRFMPFIFGITLYEYASGLMLYMITSSAFGLVEQRVTKKILGPIDPNAAGMTAAPMI